MIWQYSPFVIPYIACGMILAILGFTAWRNRSCVCARSFAFLMAAGSAWAFCTALELSSADLPTQMLAIVLEYPAMALIPVAWLLFAFEYTGRDEWITRKTVVLLSIVPAFTVLMVASNGFHHAFYSSVTEAMIGGLSYHLVTYGPAFWIHAIYSYSLIYLTILLILQRFLFSSQVYRIQVSLLLVATLLPLFVNLMLVLRSGIFELIDPTPVALMVSGFIIIAGMVRYQLLDITPIAQEQVLENMSDGVIVSDLEDRIISHNTAAAGILGPAGGLAAGRSLEEALPDLPPEAFNCGDSPDSAERVYGIERLREGNRQYFEIRSLLLQSRNGRPKGRILMIRDITGQKQTELSLAAAREKLSILSGITRHDILNQVTALLLNIEFALEQETDPEARLRLEKQDEAVKNIQRQIEFARDFDRLGASPPLWIDINREYIALKPLAESRHIAIELSGEDYEVFGDPLLKSVSLILVDNTIRHGKHVTSIRIGYEHPPDGSLLFVYEDDGTGIPETEKARIFQRGTGKDSGLGLFLVMEILGITGMTIRECGVPEKGARFEIRIPAGQFRKRS